MCCAASSTLRPFVLRANQESSIASVDVTGIRKSFDNLEVLHGVDVAIGDDEFIVLVGPSGCGKSTLLRMSRTAGIVDVNRSRNRPATGYAPDSSPRSKQVAW